MADALTTGISKMKHRAAKTRKYSKNYEMELEEIDDDNVDKIDFGNFPIFGC